MTIEHPGALKPFAEPWHVTARRTVGLALAVGIGVGIYRRSLAVVPLVTLLALWFTLGGHVLELLFRNRLARRIPSPSLRIVARLVWWFAGGLVLYLGALWTLAALTGRWASPLPWWSGGAVFVGVELLIHQVMRARGLDSFYNGLG